MTYRTYGNDPSGPGGDVTPDTVDMTMTFPSITVAKTAVSDATDARAGQPFTWQVVATNASGPTVDDAFDVAVTDTLPPGWSYVANSARVTTPYATGSAIEPACAPSCASGATLSWPGLVSGVGQPLAPGATITVRLDATPGPSLLAVGTTGTHDHVNTAAAAAADRSGASANADGGFVGPNATATARIRRADLHLSKSVSAGPYHFGADADYTVTVANDGPDTATNVRVDDQLPPGLTYRSTVSATQGTYVSSNGRWAVGTLANGASATLVIRARISAVGTIVNTAQVATSDQWDPDSTPGNASTTPAEDDTASVSITSLSTSIGDTVWYDTDGNGSQNGAEPGIPGVTVSLESAGNDGTFGTADDFWGPDGISGSADDITTTSTTTNSTGSYAFAGLPLGHYRVAVDPASLPGGLSQTYDDDAGSGGSLDHRSGVITLSNSTPYLGADFGYRGTGSIGDTVWADDNANGVLDGGEVGIANATVIVTWAGFDGTPGNADDVSWSATTSAGGTYLVDHLPAGHFVVTVDHDSLPAGYTNVFDPDATHDGTTQTTLSGGQHCTDMDFGYQQQADLAVTKTHSGNFSVGSDESYTVTARNLGPATATPVTVTDTLPAGLTYVSMTGTGFACSASGQVVTCGSTTPMGAGSSVELTLVVSVGAAAAPSVTNVVTISSPVVDPVPSNNRAEDPTAVPYADMSLAKTLTSDLRAGQRATYRFDVMNHGPSIAPTGVVVTDSLPTGLSYVSASGEGWSCAESSGVVRCTATAPIAVGVTGTINLIAEVAANAAGTLANSATVNGPTVGSGGFVDPVQSNNDSSASATVLAAETSRGSLATTGIESALLVALGLASLFAGTAVLRGRRRRPADG